MGFSEAGDRRIVRSFAQTGSKHKTLIFLVPLCENDTPLNFKFRVLRTPYWYQVHGKRPPKLGSIFMKDFIAAAQYRNGTQALKKQLWGRFGAGKLVELDKFCFN